MLRHVSLEERPIVVLGLRGGLLGANPISYRLARGVQFDTGRAFWHVRVVWHEPEQFSSELNKFDPVDCHDYHSRGYHVISCVDYIPHLSSIEDSLYHKKLYEPLAKAKPTYIRRKTSREYMNYLLSVEDRYRGRGYDRGQEANRNKSKSWKIGEIKDKEVNMARDSDDALVCCVENTVEDRIMDSGASFHATYSKEELERIKLRSGKVRLADDKSLDIAGVGNVVLKYSFGTSWTLKDVRIGMSMLASKGNVLDVQKSKFIQKVVALHLLHQYEDPATMILLSKTAAGVAVGIVMLKMVLETPLQFGVAERLSRNSEQRARGFVQRCYKKQVLGYVLTVGITTVEWESGIQKSITILSTLHFLKFLENSFEVLKLVENSVEVLKILENKLESMKILENKLDSLKLQENQPVDRLVPLSIKFFYIRKCFREAVKEQR
ncbi:hypothetical protein Tco_0666875 [Tanacetum coccineum]